MMPGEGLASGRGSGKMRRLMMLAVAAAMAVAGLGLAAPGAAQATPVCTDHSGKYNFVSSGTTRYYLGAPNNIRFDGTSAAELKPNQNSTTLWDHCSSGTTQLELEFKQFRGGATYALTTRDLNPGGNVLLQPAEDFASQRWTLLGTTGGGTMFFNVKTGLA